MQVVRDSQLKSSAGANTAVIKGDTSVQLPVDKESDKVGKDSLRQDLALYVEEGTIAIHGEESGKEGSSNAELVIQLDPLDGSRPKMVGAMTSTVIVACYDRTEKKVVACVVGEPITGRILVASLGDGARSIMPNGSLIPISTWRDDKGKKNVVYLDSYPGFTKDKRVILTDDQLGVLDVLVNRGWGKLMLGSNGQHHMLVAMGEQMSAGAITTAIGGPWDVAPVLLVLEAGGAAAAFSVTENGLEDRDPLAIDTYDILITAGSQMILDRLVQMVKKAQASKGFETLVPAVP
jgi:fructose-1,6-bisphosphatase/inositol monophosphatase family enzyme